MEFVATTNEIIFGGKYLNCFNNGEVQAAAMISHWRIMYKRPQIESRREAKIVSIVKCE